MRSSCGLQLLAIWTIAGGASGFASHPVTIGPRSSLRSSGAAISARSSSGSETKASPAAFGTTTMRQRLSSSSSPQQPASWQAGALASWFKLPPPKNAQPQSASHSLGGAKGKAEARGRRSTTPSGRDGIRAEILELRVSNAQLREEVVALRKSMVDRGYAPVDDIFASTSISCAGADEAAKVLQQQQQRISEDSKNPPPPPRPPAKLPREARLAALVALYGAAVAVGGVFVPIAIGVGASRSLRWLDEGGTLMPKRWRDRSPLGGGRERPLQQQQQQQPGLGGRGRRRRRDAELSYVKVVARLPGGDGGGAAGAGAAQGGDGAGLMTAERLADAWDEMYPPRPLR